MAGLTGSGNCNRRTWTDGHSPEPQAVRLAIGRCACVRAGSQLLSRLVGPPVRRPRLDLAGHQ